MRTCSVRLPRAGGLLWPGRWARSPRWCRLILSCAPSSFPASRRPEELGEGKAAAMEMVWDTPSSGCRDREKHAVWLQDGWSGEAEGELASGTWSLGHLEFMCRA